MKRAKLFKRNIISTILICASILQCTSISISAETETPDSVMDREEIQMEEVLFEDSADNTRENEEISDTEGFEDPDEEPAAETETGHDENLEAELSDDALFEEQEDADVEDGVEIEEDNGISGEEGEAEEVEPKSKGRSTSREGVWGNEETGESGEEINLIDDEEGNGQASETWGPDLMNLPLSKAYLQTKLDEGAIDSSVLVAVIDTGINTEHSLFKGRISGTSRSFIHEADDFNDESGHGTYVAGIIAANTPANVELMILQALDKNNTGKAEDIVDAIEYAVDSGARIINMSMSVSYSDFDDRDYYDDYTKRIDDALKYAYNRGVAVIVSAGNKGENVYKTGSFPANSRYTKSVAALSQDETFFFKSNYSTMIDYYAPGEDICGAWIEGPNAYHYLSGTSSSSALITSAYALVMTNNAGFSVIDATKRISDACKSCIIFNSINEYEKTQEIGKGQYKKVLPIFKNDTVLREKPKISAISSDGKSITMKWDPVGGETYSLFKCRIPNPCCFSVSDEDFEKIASGLSETYMDLDVSYPGSVLYFYYIQCEQTGFYYTQRSDSSSINNSCNGVSLISITTGDIFTYRISFMEEGRYDMEIGDENIAECRYDSDDCAWIIYGKQPGSTFLIRYNSDKTKRWVENIVVKPTEGAKPAEIVTSSGECGDNARWSVIEGENEYDYTLLIEGGGTVKKVAIPYYYERISKIIIGDGITELASHAFHYMPNLKCVEGMTDVVTIGSGVFFGCDHLEYITLGDKLEEIKSKAFGSTGLKKVMIPKSVTFIEEDAFFNHKIEILTVEEGNEKYISEDGALLTADKHKLIAIQRSTSYIPSEVKSIGNDVFYNRSDLYDIDLPEGLVAIGDSAFYNCRNLNRIVFPRTLENIGNYAFQNCSNLNEIVFPSILKSIGVEAFASCGLSGKVSLNTIESIGWGAFRHTSIEEISIPRITEITPEMFYECDQLSKITLSNSLRSIGSRAFYRCSALKEIQFPDTVISIGYFAFADTSLTHIHLPERIKYLRDNTFLNCPLLEVEIPRSVINIGSRCFAASGQIKKLVIHKELESLNSSAFSPCEDIYYDGFEEDFKNIRGLNKNRNLLNATLHISIEGYIGNNIKWTIANQSGGNILTISGSGEMKDFSSPDKVPWSRGRSSIKKVIVQEGITKIGRYSFYNCQALESILLPTSINDYGASVFRRANLLKAYDFSVGTSDEIVRIVPEYLMASYYEGFIFNPDISAISFNEEELEEGSDFEVSFHVSSRESESEYRGIVSVHFLSEYEAYGTVCLPFEVTTEHMKGDAANILDSSIALYRNSFLFTGCVEKPAGSDVGVKNTYGKGLTEGIHYKLSYSNSHSKDCGSYSVYAIGIGGYAGSSSELAYYTINKRNINNVSIRNLYHKTYTGEAITQDPELSIDSTELKKGTDYTVKYIDNTNVGKAFIVIEGKGNITGSRRIQFNIAQCNIDHTIVQGIIDKPYTGLAIKQSPVLKNAQGRKLYEGVDYSLYYRSNRRVGRAYVIIKGEGNYTGRRTECFKISRAKQPMRVNLKKRCFKTREMNLMRGARHIPKSRIFSVRKNKGEVRYSKYSGDRNLSVGNDGEIYIRRGTKAGFYRITVKVRANGNTYYASGYSLKTIYIKVY